MVARGRYVELATNRTDVICGGTIGYTDRFLALSFSEIGEILPERVFVRYEWAEAAVDEEGFHVSSGALARDYGDFILVSASRLLHEHELAHAVHSQPWPKGHSVLQEGFAVLFDSDSARPQSTWPSEASLDSLLDGGASSSDDYAKAWFLVSQIDRDHGMGGLRELWYAVPPDASAEHVRAAYQELFGRSIDALIEPFEEFEGFPEERLSCHFTVCDEPQPWDGDVWRAEGPFDCADDPVALGPMGNSGTGPVERHSVVELEPATPYRFIASGGAGAYLRPCGLQCQPRGTPADIFFPDMPVTRPDYPDGRYRVEIVVDFEDLPTDTPSSFEIERLD